MLAAAIVAILSHNTFCPVVGAQEVASFAALVRSIDSGHAAASVLSITAPGIIFGHQIDVHEGTAVSIVSAVGAKLSGARHHTSRLFVLKNNSKLSLFGVTLSRGSCTDRNPLRVARIPGCNGGAIVLNHGGELLLSSVHLLDNRAGFGGGIYAAGNSTVTASATVARVGPSSSAASKRAGRRSPTANTVRVPRSKRRTPRARWRWR